MSVDYKLLKNYSTSAKKDRIQSSDCGKPKGWLKANSQKHRRSYVAYKRRYCGSSGWFVR